MSTQKPSKSAKANKAPRVLPLLFILGGLAVLALIATVGGFAFAAAQEQHDTFCASCHTQPESTYFDRSVAAAPVDMASAHTAEKVNCIDCHSGTGLAGRLSAELLGAWNAGHWYTGTAIQPAKLTRPIPDENCIKCHQETIGQRATRNNHFHPFLARWQLRDPNAATCVSCHGGHTTTGSASARFIDTAQARQVCNDCHRAMGEGGE